MPDEPNETTTPDGQDAPPPEDRISAKELAAALREVVGPRPDPEPKEKPRPRVTSPPPPNFRSPTEFPRPPKPIQVTEEDLEDPRKASEKLEAMSRWVEEQTQSYTGPLAHATGTMAPYVQVQARNEARRVAEEVAGEFDEYGWGDDFRENLGDIREKLSQHGDPTLAMMDPNVLRSAYLYHRSERGLKPIAEGGGGDAPATMRPRGSARGEGSGGKKKPKRTELDQEKRGWVEGMRRQFGLGDDFNPSAEDIASRRHQLPAAG